MDLSSAATVMPNADEGVTRAPSIALVAIGYNRVHSMERLLRSLDAADYCGDDVTLIISIDYSGDDAVERMATAYRWAHGPKRVKTHDSNLGLRRHIMSQGVEELDEFDAIIVLEDDIVVSPVFYRYARQCVERYADVEQVAGISLYSFPLNYLTSRPFEPWKGGDDVYFMRTAQSWGEVWMRRSWREFYDWYLSHQEFSPSDEIPATLFHWSKSWLKYHTRYCQEQDRYFVYPYFSLSSNCGDAGTHNGAAGAYDIYQTNMAMSLGDAPLRLPRTPGDGVCYDSFFENEALPECVSHQSCIPMEDVTVDLNGYRGPGEDKRYLLTTRPYPFKMVAGYLLSRHPVEANVMIDGPLPQDSDTASRAVEIYLYDTSCRAAVLSGRRWPSGMILYSYRILNFLTLARRYGAGNIVNLALGAVRRKLHL